jgi:hypothetical protein
MADGLRNIICEPSDVLRDIKREILEIISLNKVVCNNLPNLEIPNTLPSIPSINPSQAVVDFLKDILAVVKGINYEEMRLQLIDWLVEQVEPLEKDIALNLKLSLKECYACKIAPKIPNWMFVTNPDTGGVGQGINIELGKLDLTCMFSVNPNSEVGKLVYDGTQFEDMNTFLWYVIQNNGSPILWKDPVTGKEIAQITYLENNPSAYISSTTGGVQNTNPQPMVFNMKIVDQYHDKSMIDFINDYVNSQTPIFDADKVVPKTIDLIYGTITNKIKLPEGCITNIVELEQAIEDYINVGIENPDVVIDNSFYEFTPEQTVSIKEKVLDKKIGVKKFERCCGRKSSKIPFDTVSNLVEEIKASSTLNEKLTVYSKGMDKISTESSDAVSGGDKDKATSEFFSSFITGIQIAVTKMTLSPKVLMLVYSLYYLVNGEFVEGNKIKDILRSIECILRNVIGRLIEKLIYEFLLPLIINALKNLILCALTKKLKEKNIYYLLSIGSLLPGFAVDKLDKVNQLLGKGSQIAEQARGFADKVNLNSLNNINLQTGNRGRFCD